MRCVCLYSCTSCLQSGCDLLFLPCTHVYANQAPISKQCFEFTYIPASVEEWVVVTRELCVALSLSHCPLTSVVLVEFSKVFMLLHPLWPDFLSLFYLRMFSSQEMPPLIRPLSCWCARFDWPSCVPCVAKRFGFIYWIWTIFTCFSSHFSFSMEHCICLFSI